MKKLCTECGHIGGTKTITKGSIGFEIIFWLLFVIPGLIYSIWRHTSRHEACPACGNHKMIPVNSPMAKRFIDANGLSTAKAPTAPVVQSTEWVGKLYA